MKTIQNIFNELGMNSVELNKGTLTVESPIDGAEIAKIMMHSEAEIETILQNSVDAFNEWKIVPSPQRGELIRVLGNKLRERKEILGRLVTLECGKIYQEGLGEVQEILNPFLLGNQTLNSYTEQPDQQHPSLNYLLLKLLQAYLSFHLV